MNLFRNIFTGTVFALAAAIPTAQAQQAQPQGPIDCGIAYATCLATGGSAITCSIEFIRCLAGGGTAAVAERREG